MAPPGANSNSNPAGTRSDTMQPSAPCSIQGAMLKGRSSRKLLATALVDKVTSEQSTPATAGATAAAAESRAELTCRSPRRLSTAADADADWQEQNSTPTRFRTMLSGKSSRKLPTTPAMDSDSEALDRDSEAGNVTEQPWQVPYSSSAARSYRAQVSGKSSRKLPTTPATDSDSEALDSDSEAGTVTEQPWQVPYFNSAARSYRAQMSGKSFRKLPTTPAMDSNSEALDSDSEAGNVTEQPWQVPYFNSAARNYRAQMSGKSSRNLTFARDSDSSACTLAQQPSQLYDLSTSTSATRSKLVGKSSRRLLLSASCTRRELEDNAPCASDGSPERAGVGISFAGKSSRKLLHVLDSAIDSGNPMAGRSTTCSGMLSGPSSCELLGSAAGSADLHSLAAVTPAANTRSLGTPNTAMLLSKSSGKLLSLTSAVHQQGSCGVHTRQLGAHSLAAGSGSQLSINSLPSSRALLAGRSSRRLPGLAALAHPQLSDAEQLSSPDSDDDGGLADAVVHIKFTDSSMDSSEALGLGKPLDNTPVAYAAVSDEQRAKIDSLALLLSNAAEKDILLDAVAELQDLAAGSPAVRLAIGQHPQVVQGLADLLDDSDLDLQCAAVALTCDLASGVQENQSTLGTNSGLVSGLVQLLHNSDKAVRANAAVALMAVAAENLTVQGKVDCNGSHNMVECILSPYM